MAAIFGGVNEEKLKEKKEELAKLQAEREEAEKAQQKKEEYSNVKKQIKEEKKKKFEHSTAGKILSAFKKDKEHTKSESSDNGTSKKKPLLSFSLFQPQTAAVKKQESRNPAKHSKQQNPFSAFEFGSSPLFNQPKGSGKKNGYSNGWGSSPLFNPPKKKKGKKNKYFNEWDNSPLFNPPKKRGKGGMGLGLLNGL